MLRVIQDETSTWLGSTVRVPRHQQDVVEGQGRGEADRNLISVEDVGSGFHASVDLLDLELS